MLFKIIFLLFILMLAYGLVVILLRRLTHTAQQLALLREQMHRSDRRLSDQLREVHREQERLRAQVEAEKDLPGG